MTSHAHIRTDLLSYHELSGLLLEEQLKSDLLLGGSLLLRHQLLELGQLD